MIRHVAVVPTTPLVLPGWPGAVHPDLGRIAAAARRALDGVEAADVVILLAGGPPAGGGAGTSSGVTVHADLSAPAALSLRGYGVDLPDHPLTPVVDRYVPLGGRDRSTTGGLVDRDVPVGGRDRSSTGAGDLVVLARQVPVGTAAVGVVVAPDADAVTTAEVAAAVLRLAEARAVSVVCAGDLGAGFGPKPPRPAAAAASHALQDLVVAALDGGRPADLVRLDPDLVRQSASRAAGALRVLGAILDGARIGTVVRTAGAPLGVGYVVAAGG